MLICLNYTKMIKYTTVQKFGVSKISLRRLNKTF